MRGEIFPQIQGRPQIFILHPPESLESFGCENVAAVFYRYAQIHQLEAKLMQRPNGLIGMTVKNRRHDALPRDSESRNNQSPPHPTHHLHFSLEVFP
jgi:hypothetical protein